MRGAVGARNSGFEGSSAATNGQAWAPRKWPLTCSLTGRYAGGGERNRTAVEGFAGPCLDHSATPPGLYRESYFTTSGQPVAVTSALVDMRRTFDALGTLQRVAIVSAIVFGAASGLMTAAGAPDVAVFIVSALAIAAFAAVVGQCIDQIGDYMGPGPTGLLQSSVGNLPELFVSIFALREGLRSVVQSALVGSVLANVLLVLGAASLTGGARHGPQRFRPEAPRMLVTLLTVSVGAVLVPTLAARLNTPAAQHGQALSHATAVVLLLVYIASVPFWLSGGPGRAGQAAQKGEAKHRD